MTKYILTLALVIGLTTISKAQMATEINTFKSIVNWTGSNLFKYNKHYGYVGFKSGTIIKTDNKIIDGEFVIAMNSITNTDGKYNDMLVGHLKSQDFFHVEKNPEAKLKFVNVVYKNQENIEILADLTIKGITNKIRFTADLKMLNGNEVMTSKFIIDRTLWGINYESKGIFGSLKDNIISDAVEFEVTVEWKANDKC